MKTQIMVAFTLIGNGIDPDVVTQELGIKPSETGRKGERRINDPKCLLVHKCDFWSISKGYKDSLDLGSEVKLLLEEIMPYSKIIRNLCKKMNLFAEIECDVKKADDDSYPSIHFGVNTLNQIAELGAEIDIDIN